LPSPTEAVDAAELPPVAGGVEAAAALKLPTGIRKRIADFDATVESKFDLLRGHPIADRIFYTASEVGDFALIWHMIAAARGLRSDRDANDALRVAAILGAETILVNGVIKSFFRRTRPDWEQHRAFRIRRPRSSSFPSGHASSAFTAAGVLSQDDPLWPLFYTVAAVVAASRVYVKIHHPSDVVAGIATGVVLARVARRIWPKAE
jgi:membrane-associated phospholipid phosphatase